MAGGQTTAQRSRSRVGGLDGLRGLAVAAVLLYHSQLGFTRGGFLGVSAFFTLSGFLITSLLLTQQREQHRVRLGTFWGRRARRLLPAALLTLFGVLVFGLTVATPDQLRLLRGDVLATLAYVANWRFYESGQSYAQLFSAPSPVLHFWFLAIEEQFYLVFPLVVALIGWTLRGRSDRRRRQVLGAALTAGIAASVIAGRVLYPRNGSARAYYGTDARAAELLIGALLAVILSGRVTSARPATRRTQIIATSAGIGALALMIWWWSTVDQSAAWLYHGGFALHACCAAVVIAAIRVDGPLSRALSWKPLAALGLISYGVYLFHWPIFLWLTPERTGLPTVPLLAVRLALTLTLAVASFRFIEQPILRGERPWRARALRIPARFAIPGAVLAVVTVLFLVTASPPAPTIVFAPVSSTPSALHSSRLPASARQSTALQSSRPVAPPPSTADKAARAAAPTPKPVPLYRPFDDPRPLRILVVGDSVGLTLGRGFELWGAQTGRAVVENDAIELCSLGRALSRRLPLGEIAEPTDACAGWAMRWPRTIASFDPDVVIVQYSVWEAEARALPDGHFARPGDDALDRWQLGEYQAAADALSARGAPVLWLDIACEGARIERGEPFWNVDYRTIPALVASRPAVHEVDMNHLMCPGGKPRSEFGGATDVRPDDAHFSDPGALAVASWLMPIVLGEQPRPPRIFAR